MEKKSRTETELERKGNWSETENEPRETKIANNDIIFFKKNLN